MFQSDSEDENLDEVFTNGISERTAFFNSYTPRLQVLHLETANLDDILLQDDTHDFTLDTTHASIPF